MTSSFSSRLLFSVTHIQWLAGDGNCHVNRLSFNGWREAAAHQWLGPNNAMNVWPVKG
jgi:hypothetical protein